MAVQGVYSMGLCGYEMWVDESDNSRMMVRFVGTEQEHAARSYKICATASGRFYVRPHGRRIYLDQVMRV